MKWWIPLLLAVQFLTRIPVPGLNGLTAETAKAALAKSVIWFPLVGGLVGLITAAILILANHFWPRMIAVILALMVEARLTGAFHEDAVSDFCDGFGGGMTAERIHEIMKDSRIGSYGALGLALAVGLRVALLCILPNALVLPALVASAGFGRYIAVWLMAIIPPLVQAGGLAKDVGAQASMRQLAIATLFAVPVVTPFAIVMPIAFGAVLGLSLLFTLWFRQYLLRHLGGVTGDCLGFGVYVGQILLLLAATASLP
jgi:adenosylcobinamide-GDP ribazoletransferase